MPSIRCLARGARFAEIAALTGLLGCATTPQKSAAPLSITMNALGNVSFMGAPMAVEQLPQRLRKAGYPPTQEIRVHLTEADHHTQAMARISDILHKSGYMRVLFVEAPRAISHVAGEPDIVAPPTPSEVSPPSGKTH